MKTSLDDKTKELIAIGASISAHCQPCLTYHVAKAKELGIEPGLIKDAIDTGYRVQQGAAVAMREFTHRVLTVAMPDESQTHAN